MTSPDVPVRDASTVVLLRDGPAGIETWLLTRVTQMAFAAGMTVFPGGRVDASDAALPMAGDLAAVAARLGCPDELARALVGAALRETFEETGVLLTVPPCTDFSSTLPDARADVEDGRLAFGELLASHELSLDVAALAPWSRWVTPAGETRRYDTRFFVGTLPDGAEPADVTTESSAAAWLPIGSALEQAQRGERKILPPTLVTLLAVQALGTVAGVLAAAPAQSMDPVRPSLEVADDGTVTVTLPDGAVHTLPGRP